MEIKLRTLTPLWTGGVDQTCDRLHETGLIGSLRWWYEALVRGLGGYACDPASNDRCPDQDGKRCVVCELFGCTGWARRFRLQTLSPIKILRIKGNLKAVKDQEIKMKILPLRPIMDEEHCLLQLTLRLISEYGAIGGKTVFKPSDEQTRDQEFHHRDFGLVKIETVNWPCTPSLDKLKTYVTSDKWRKGDHKYSDNEGKHDYSWASLQNFWCVKKWYLARQSEFASTFNRVIGRRQHKKQAQNLAQNTPENVWIAGKQQESKKVFSFKYPVEGRRTFGFVKPGLVDFDEMKKRLKQVWGSNFDPNREFLTAEQILASLFRPVEGRNDL